MYFWVTHGLSTLGFDHLAASSSNPGVGCNGRMGRAFFGTDGEVFPIPLQLWAFTFMGRFQAKKAKSKEHEAASTPKRDHGLGI